jgi:hypothetical protein
VSGTGAGAGTGTGSARTGGGWGSGVDRDTGRGRQIPPPPSLAPTSSTRYHIRALLRRPILSRCSRTKNKGIAIEVQHYLGDDLWASPSFS